MPFFVEGTAVLTRGEQYAGEGRGAEGRGEESRTVGCVHLQGTGVMWKRGLTPELTVAVATT